MKDKDKVGISAQIAQSFLLSEVPLSAPLFATLC
jgi:hypothetical protein